MALARGDRLGPYEIVGPLGAGGMGEVYRARDTRLERDVAIKVLPDSTARDGDALARFGRETKAVAALNHPNILAIHDVGDVDGRAFAVTELLEGETLRARLRRGPLPTAEGIDIAVAIAEGLSAAHTRGIVHRDLKPENVFLTSDGRVKVLDFGLACWTSDSEVAASAATLTAAGVVVGTVGYMSPEQARGGTIGAPSDIFSLGTMLFEMFTGRRAFDRPTSAETMAAIMNDDPPATLDSGRMPADLARLIRRCLEKRPHDRFQSGSDLAFSLRGVGHTPTPAPHPPASDSIDSLAVLPFVNAGGNPDTEYLSDGIAESLINSLSQMPGLRVVPRSRAFRFKGQDIEPKKVGRQLKVRALLTGKVLQRGDVLNVQAELVDVARESQLWGERFNRKMTDIFTVEEEIATQISGKLRLRLTGADHDRLRKRQTENIEAYHLYLKGMFHWNKRTGEELRKALECFQQAANVDPLYAMAHTGLADGYLLLSVFVPKRCRDLAELGKAAGLKALEIDPGLAEALSPLGLLRWTLDWDAAGAERDLLRGLAAKPDYMLLHNHYGLLLSALGRHDAAVAQVTRGLELEPVSPVAAHHAAWILIRARRYDEAIDRCRRTLEVEPRFPAAHSWLGIALSLKGEYDEALQELQIARQSTGQHLQAFEMARAYTLSGRRAEAEQIMHEMQQQFEREYADPYWFGIATATLGNVDEAFKLLNRAVDDRNPNMALWMAGDPRLDSIAGDPRMHALLRRIGVARD